jgi:5-methyltetrahydropteroyltriglutamate--homocysteine methyltransferase
MSIEATCLGYPRVGAARELKKSLERFWSGKASAADLESTAADLRRRHWLAMKAAGIDQIPSNDFSLYDHVLDTAVMLGAIPARYQSVGDPLARYFAMARGLQDGAVGIDIPAMEMTKWFDTNYHYIVPEIELDQEFSLNADAILRDIDEARAIGIAPRPVILGPVSFVLLSKPAPGYPGTIVPISTVDALIPVYEKLLGLLAGHGVEWVQIDEPCLVVDLDRRGRGAYERALKQLSRAKVRPKLMLATYFGGLDDNISLAMNSGFDALHIDLVRAPEQLDPVLAAIAPTMALSLGLVDGRNIWRSDLDAMHAVVRRAIASVGASRVMVSPSCSLLHTPFDLANEKSLDAEVQSWLAFSEQKLREMRALADAATDESPHSADFEAARAALASRRSSTRTHNTAVRDRVSAIRPDMLVRSHAFPQRAIAQQERFGLPDFPTTTIGSFPQTADVRAARAAWRTQRMSDESYEAFLKDETSRCIAKQESLGLDVLVHGEFERNDMVEHFGERLDGFAFSENGWVQSYGSRCVKPPIIFGDVARPAAMTVEWSRYAQSLTNKPVKGMLTGPVTILQWSFVRDDQPRSITCAQIALALRDEVRDLEDAGIAMIQVDEPAIREGLPLRRKDRPAYLRWAVDAFRLATAGVRDETQIHTHMCYSEFGDILESVAALDADVLSVESSRSKMELLADFARVGYPNHVGPGVYDIHSPRVPTTAEMVGLLSRAAAVLRPAQLWVNPDCGLKTRAWPEVDASLAAMVEAARLAREGTRAEVG